MKSKIAITLGLTTISICAAIAQNKEAPSLTALTQSGQLPALSARLPKTPLVIKPQEKVGMYGGTWRSALRGTADQAYLRRLVSYDSLVRWDTVARQFVPNIAESWAISSDAKNYNFKLREGMRWSDGTPFTSADILYWFKIKQEKLTGGSRLETGTCVPSAPNPYQVVFNCNQSYGLLLDSIAGPGGDEMVSYPQHWMKQFHATTADPVKLQTMIAETKSGKWETLFERRGESYLTAGKPSIAPWIVQQPYTGTQVSFERNPYYWKLDTAGNQLPYLDKVSFQVAQDNEVLLLKGLAGEFDFHARHFNTIANKSVVFQNRERGRYDIIEMETTDANFLAIHLNMGHQNEARRKLFQNKDFRIGLSHAINRNEIIDLVLLGAGIPWQSAPRGSSPYFNPTLARQFTEFNTRKANEHLDKAGVNKDAQGRRLGPDGQPIGIRVTVRSDKPEMQKALQLVQKHWATVGVRLDLDVVERSLFRQRYRANLHDAAADDIEGGSSDFMQLADGYVPMDNTSYFGTAWFNWLDNRRGDPKTSLEPPVQVKKAHELFIKAGQTADKNVRGKIIKEILDIAADQFYSIGIAAPSGFYGIVARNMRNVPRQQLDSYALAFPGPYAPEQFFIQK